ncbi:MAG: hypothetical protein AAGC65_04830 [Mucilaginibacter sp.]|uniref:glucosamine inositolphosphorylceramide transferase family protein n=1 Tax=Mucilaginibacter sp. TaxID=1882438 RepID=UPI0031B080F7
MTVISLLLICFNKLFVSDKWNIGYVHQTPADLIATQKLRGKITWLKEGDDDYAADPFIINIDGHLYIFYEELNFWKGKGEIAFIDDLSLKKKKRVKGIMNRSVHLSYPYMFTANDQLYCIPETSESKQVALYEVDKNNLQNFKKVSVILKDDNYVDNSIIYYQDKYWLFTSISGKHGELYIYYADNLFDDFKAHGQNPIKVDDHASRSAGRLFIVDGKLYMPSQNPAKCYGGSVMINEITKLNETEFERHTAFELLPQAPYDKGLHTITFADGLLIVDGKRSVYNALNPLKKVIRKIRNSNVWS